MCNDSATYSSLRNSRDSQAVRYNKNVKPFGQNTIAEDTSPYLEYRLPRDSGAILDGHNMVHYFKCGTDVAGVHDNIASIWRSLQVFSGSNEIQNIREYGHLAVTLDNLHLKSDERNSGSAVVQGIPNLGVTAATQYGHHVLRDTFLDTMLPVSEMPQLRVQWELNQSLAQHTEAPSGQAVSTLDITVPEMKCPYVKDPKMMEKIKSGPYQFHFRDYDYFTNTASSSATTASYVVQTSHKSVSGLILVMRANTTLANADLADKYQNQNVFNLSKFQIVIDGQPIPQEQVSCERGVRLYHYLEEFAGGKEHVGEWFDGDYDGTKFVLFFPLNAEPFQREALSGADINSKTGQIEVNLTFASGLAADTTINTFVRYEKVATISNGSLRIEK